MSQLPLFAHAGESVGRVGFTEHPAGVERVFGCLLMAAGFFLIARF